MRAHLMAAAAIMTGAGCAGGTGTGPEARFAPVATYLSDDLLSVTLDIDEGTPAAAIRKITDCAAAEAAVLQGNAFLRHVRTGRVSKAGIFRADAVYSVSKQLPAGAFVLDAEIVAENCRIEGTLGV